MTASGNVDSANVRSEAEPWEDATEHLVAEVWHRVLASKSLNRNTSLLEMRTGMLQIYRFLGQLENATGMPLPVTVVFQAPTVRELANVLRSGRLPVFDPVIPIRTGTSGVPLFILPGLGGSVFQLFELARTIVYPGAVYVNQQVGLDGVRTPHRTMEEMIRFQADAIRAKQPQGPYSLVGYSFGGTLALEVARHLVANGGDIRFLGLIEPHLPERNWPAAAGLAFLMRRLNDHRKSLQGMTAREAGRHVGQHAKPVLKRIGRMLGRAGDSRSPYQVQGLPDAVERLATATHEAVCRYKIQDFNGPISLFLSEGGDPLACDPLQAWPRYLTNLHVTTVAGDHATMISGRNISGLAARISDRLRAAS